MAPHVSTEAMIVVHHDDGDVCGNPRQIEVIHAVGNHNDCRFPSRVISLYVPGQPLLRAGRAFAIGVDAVLDHPANPRAHSESIQRSGYHNHRIDSRR